MNGGVTKRRDVLWSYGNENWEFNDDGLMASRFASINDILILGLERKYH